MTEHQIFPTRVYTEHLHGVARVRDLLLRDVLALVAPTEDSPPLNRTREMLEQRAEPHWDTYFGELHAVVDSVADSLHPSWTHRAVHSWGLVFRTCDEWPSNFQSIHSHAQATFSTVCYLQVPPELADSGSGGTLLRNPLAHIHHRYYDIDYIRFDPIELDVLVFPGFLEHLPERPDSATVFSSPRVVVTTDYCYY